MKVKKLAAAIAAAVMSAGLAALPAAAETTGTLGLGEVFFFERGSGIEVPQVERISDHNVVYTDRGITIYAGTRYGIDEYMVDAATNIGNMQGTVFESVSNKSIYQIRNTDDDSGNINYNGWIEVEAEISESGIYRISILGDTSQDRSCKIMYNGSKLAETNTIKGTAVASADIGVTEDMINNNIVSFNITGNNACPNIFAIHIAKVEPTFTASVVDGSIVTDIHGDGEFENETASGFVADITSNVDGATASSMSLSVDNVDKGTTAFSGTGITLDKDAHAYVGIIVGNTHIDNDSAIKMEVN